AALALPFWGVGVPTNGEIVAGGCCLVMALCIPAGEQAGSGWRRLLPLLLVASMVPLSALLARGVPVGGYVAVLLALLAGCTWGGRARAALVLGLAAFVLVPMHRSAVLFLPLGAVVMVWLAVAQGHERLSRRLVRVLSLAAALLAALVLARWAGIARVPDPGLVLSRLFDILAGTNFTRDADSLMGISSKVALFEVARSVGPFLLLFGLAAAWRREPDPRFLPAQAAGVALFLLVMVGLPFGHRAAFLVVVLLAGVVAARLQEADAAGRRRQGLLFLGFTVLLAVAEYSLPQASGAALNHVARGAPLVLAMLACAAAAMAWCLRTRRYGAVLLLVLFGTVVAERQIIRAHFMHYAYPDVPPARSTPVSHYAQADIEGAGWLRGETRRVAVLSDPYTMAILRALAGVNSIVTFSNLDTGRQQVRKELHAYLHALVASGEGDAAVCPDWRAGAKLLDYGSSAEFNYVLRRLLDPTLSGDAVLAMFGYRNSLLISSGGKSGPAP
ncbi:MAG: hypothetical protein HGA47_16280, partial [Zoogloea sp.]|nr:hypothetical protein [Zoogloea sp.]